MPSKPCEPNDALLNLQFWAAHVTCIECFHTDVGDCFQILLGISQQLKSAHNPTYFCVFGFDYV